jgi:bacterioferritin-associated ferredoxin
MIVCHCKGITDRDIRKAVATGALTSAEIGHRCGAGTDCGGCRPLIDLLVVRRDGLTTRRAQSSEG